jgi:hypothetical protein
MEGALVEVVGRGGLMFVAVLELEGEEVVRRHSVIAAAVLDTVVQCCTEAVEVEIGRRWPLVAGEGDLGHHVEWDLD